MVVFERKIKIGILPEGYCPPVPAGKLSVSALFERVIGGMDDSIAESLCSSNPRGIDEALAVRVRWSPQLS